MAVIILGYLLFYHFKNFGLLYYLHYSIYLFYYRFHPSRIITINPDEKRNTEKTISCGCLIFLCRQPIISASVHFDLRRQSKKCLVSSSRKNTLNTLQTSEHTSRPAIETVWTVLRLSAALQPAIHIPLRNYQAKRKLRLILMQKPRLSPWLSFLP